MASALGRDFLLPKDDICNKAEVGIFSETVGKPKIR